MFFGGLVLPLWFVIIIVAMLTVGIILMTRKKYRSVGVTVLIVAIIFFIGLGIGGREGLFRYGGDTGWLFFAIVLGVLAILMPVIRIKNIDRKKKKISIAEGLIKIGYSDGVINLLKRTH